MASPRFCTTDANGAETCVEIAQGMLVWGPDVGTWQEGLALIITAYLAGYVVAAVGNVLLKSWRKE